MNQLTISSTNVKGLLNPKKIVDIRNFCSQDDIILLQETHGDKSHYFKKTFKRQGQFSFYKSNARGSGLLYKDKVKGITKYKDSFGRLSGALIDTGKTKIGIISAYMPNVTQSQTDQENYMKCLTSLEAMIMEVQDKSKYLIIGGDFNVVFNPHEDSITGKAKSYPLILEQIDELMERFDLVDAFRAIHPDEKAFTYSPVGNNPRQIYNRLDYFLISRDLTQYITKIEHKDNWVSDHKTVRMQLSFSTIKEKFRNLWRHNDELLNNDEYVENMKEMISLAADNSKGMNAKSRWDYIQYKLRQYSRNAASIIQKDQNREKQNTIKQLEEANKDVVGNADLIQELNYKMTSIIRKENEKISRQARAKFMEENEKMTSYFFRQIKQNSHQSNIIELEKNDNILNTDEVNKEIWEFYSSLYQKEDLSELTIDWLGIIDDMPKVPENRLKNLRKEILKGEIKFTLKKKLHKGKSPGNTGLTVKFFTFFWSELEEFYHAALKQSLQEGQLSVSQRQSVVRLIQKKGKCPRNISNWRPISLMNVDIKILTKIIANRIEKALPEMLDQSQLAYVKGKNINEGIRTIDYTIDFCERTKSKGALVAIDFRKAFDSVSHEYLLNLMAKIGFPEAILHVIKTLYNGAESAVMNNGLTTKYFPLGKGCRQGDALSPYLFIIAIDPLIRMIKGEKGIQGIKTPAGNLKITAYADDITIFAQDERDIIKVLRIITNFGNFSGLKLNEDKTEILKVGGLKDTQFKDERLKKLTVSTIKITGVHFGNSANSELAERLNFDPIVANIKRKLNEWNTRDLSILGRVLVVKAQAIGQLQYMANSICVPKNVTKEVKKLIYRFVWKGVDKIKRNNASKPLHKGGINLPMLDNIMAAAAVQWLKKRKCKPDRPWAKFMDADFRKIGGYTGFNNSRLRKDNKDENMAKYNIYLLEKWNEICKEDDIKVRDLSIFKNRKFSYKEKRQVIMLQCDYLMRLGYCTVNQFYDADGRIIEAEASHFKDDMIGKMEWTRATKVLSTKLGRKIERGYAESNTSSINLYLVDETVKVDISVLTQSRILKILAKKETYEISNFISNQTETLKCNVDSYMNNFKLIWNSTQDTKTRSFFYRYLHGLTYANKQLKTFGFKATSKCTFCNHPEQDRYHLFEGCQQIRNMRKIIRYKLTHYLKTESEERKKMVEFFIEMMCCQYIYKCNYKGDIPNIKAFAALLGTIRQIEYDIAVKKRRMGIYNMKWYSIDKLNL